MWKAEGGYYLVWEHATLARAVKASWRGRIALSRNEHALPVRRRLWDEERARVAAEGPVFAPDEEDLEALELVN